MTSDRDIWASARLYVDRYGQAAPIEAAMKADALAEKGNYAGQRTWLRIITAIEWLQDNRGRDPFKLEH